jgi:hypothetical protein
VGAACPPCHRDDCVDARGLVAVDDRTRRADAAA